MYIFIRRSFVTALFIISLGFYATSAATNYDPWSSFSYSGYTVKHGGYAVRNHYYSYLYRGFKEYDSRKWQAPSKYYGSKKYYGGRYYYQSSKYSSKKKYGSRWNYKYKKCRGKHRNCSKCGKHGKHGKHGKSCHKPKGLKPVAVDDEYFIKAGDAISQNVVSENDTKGDGNQIAYIKYGSLPQGITLSRDGSLNGLTEETGTFFAYYKLKDQDYDYSKAKITIHVAPDLKPVAVEDEYTLKAGDILDAYIVTQNDTKGDGEQSVSITSGDLPNGITLSEIGVLSGSTDDLGAFVVHYELKDSDGDTSEATITISVSTDVAYCPTAAESDELHNGNSRHAVWIPQISKNLTFVEQPTAVRTLPSGGLLVSGTIEDGDLLFDITMIFSGYAATSDDPKRELKSSAYIENGGPIDPTTWGFFENLEGTLIGTTGDWDGVTFSFSRRGPMGQLGDGANGKNANFGFSSWFDAQIVGTNGTESQLPEGFHIGQKLYGDINVDLPDECRIKRELTGTQCSIAAEVDSFAQYSGGHSVVLFGLGEQKFAFEPAAEVRNYDNGDLEISGVIIDSNGQGFNVELVYSEATITGTPKLELIDSAYVDMAGPVDPSLWSYFDGFTGTLTGLPGDYNGVDIVLGTRGPSAQTGDGADGKNVTFGLSNWFTAEVVGANQTLGLSVGDTFNGDVNVTIKDDCAVVVDNPVDAVDDVYVLNIGQTLNVNILDNDELGDPATVLSFSPFNIPSGFTLNSNGQLTGSFFFSTATVSFIYTITDVDGDTDTATVTISAPGGGPE